MTNPEISIGKAVLSVIQGGMDSSTPAIRSALAKPIIRMPETADEARALKAWADAEDDRPEPASANQIGKHLAFMSATLPSKSSDEDSGKMRFAVYSRILGEFSNHALAYMARKACETLDWFPTPRQCLEILQGYRAPPTEKDDALQLCHRFWQGKFEDWFAAVQDGNVDQDTIDNAPKQWRMIAMERGLLRLMPDGSFVLRRKVIGA